jgi:hypothetical protein
LNKKTKRAITAVTALALTTLAQAQQATEQSIHGKWFVSGIADESMTFAAGGDLFLTKIRIRKDVPPMTVKTEGAYRVGPSACTVGPNAGNLWIVKDKSRCCFNAYHLGKSLVLDEVKGTGITAGPAPGSICENKTLRREPEVEK